MPTINSPKDVFKVYDMRGPDECWPYIGGAWGGQAREKRPYFMANRRRQIAYRWIYELVNGVVLTSDQLILHACDCGGFPVGCGNPGHMRVGTLADNTSDAMARSRHGLPKHVVRAMRKLLAEGRTQQEVAALYGISRTGVGRIARGEIHSHVLSTPDGNEDASMLSSSLDPEAKHKE